MNLTAEESEGQPFLTGYFRDGKRKIDLILVAKETGDPAIEKIKMDFLTNAINMGLELEIEGGFDESVLDLIFIKIHGPDRVVKHFGFYYNMKKYFKKSHIEFIFNYIKYEKQLIKTVRRWYPGPMNYSTIERATIVYKALLSCPFGKPFNHVGVNQLIDKKIFLDLYPLHDGPYQLTVGQTPLELNGRQALYHTWCGTINVFTRNPVHLIREYFGERVAFLFMFYQFYNRWLFLLAVIGIALFASNYNYEGNEMRNIVLNERNKYNEYEYTMYRGSGYGYGSPNKDIVYKYKDLPVCPKCIDFVACPFRNMTLYGRELKIKVFLANPYNFLLPFVVPIWGILFYIFWKRREHYLYWMWECTDKDAKILTRPHYRALELPTLPPQKTPVITKGDKIMAPNRAVRKQLLVSRSFGTRRFHKNLIEFLLMMLFLVFIFFGYFALMMILDLKIMNKMRYVEDWMRVRKGVEQIYHSVLDTLGSVHGVCILVMEYLWFKISRWMAKFDNARSEYMHEETHSVNLFGVSLLINLAMLCFYAFLKGALYRTPNDEECWQIPLGLGMYNCGLLTCIDEAFIIFVATFKTKTCIEDLYRFLEKWQDDRAREPPSGTQEVRTEGPLWTPGDADSDVPMPPPCWEREFHLKRFDETFFWKHLNKILLQYAIVTFFMTCFQLGPIFAFLWNIWHQNYLADMVVKYYRRPLMTQTWGLGGWDNIVIILPYLACFFNALFMAKHNTLMHIRFNKKYWSHQKDRRFLADYYMGFFNVTDNNLPGEVAKAFRPYYFRFKGSVPAFCMFSGQINRLVTFENKHRVVHSNRYMPMAGYYYILWHQALLLLLPMIMILLVSGILHVMIGTKSHFVAENEYVEEAVKKYDITRDMARGGEAGAVPRSVRRRRVPAAGDAR